MEKTEKRVVHCWTDKAEVMAEQFGWGSDEWLEAFIHDATCMLLYGHDGPHEFVSDDDILVTFSDVDEKEGSV